MSSSVEQVEIDQHEFPGTPVQINQPAPGSLEARIAERRDALEKHTSEVFDVPGFEGILRVELKIIGAKVQFAIVESAQRLPDQFARALYLAGELATKATVRFFAVNKETGEDEEAEGFSWLAAARTKWPEITEATPERACALRILGDEGLTDLVGEWRQWMTTRGAKLDQQIERDFS